MMISPIPSSATLRVLEKGALKTGMPSVRAAVRSTWFGADAKASNHPQTIGWRQGLRCQLSSRADAKNVHTGERLREFRALQGLCLALDACVASIGEESGSAVTDAFQL
jgi:hypothetical protein